MLKAPYRARMGILYGDDSQVFPDAAETTKDMVEQEFAVKELEVFHCSGPQDPAPFCLAGGEEVM